MSDTGLLDAMLALAQVLEQENALLAALDLAAATRLLPAKQRAADGYARAQAKTRRAGGAPPDARHALAVETRRLAALADENRRLLQRGLAAQGRVIAVFARAARLSQPEAGRYAGSGAAASPRCPAPMAVSARV